MDVQPLISIVVPVYNVKQFLTKCLNSIIGQTYSNLEIIVVDDGSTDGRLRFVMIMLKRIIVFQSFTKKTEA